MPPEVVTWPASQARSGRAATYRRTLLSSYASFAANIVLYAIATPWILHRLGASAFGSWLILLQTAYIVPLATTWIAAPLLRETAGHYASHDLSRVRRVIVTGSRYYAVVGLFAVGVFAFAGMLPPVHRYLHLDASTVETAALLLGIYTAVNLQTQVVLNVLSGFQHADAANWLTLGAAVAATILAVIAVGFGAGVVGLAAAYAVGFGVVYLASIVYLYSKMGVHPFARGFDWGLLRALLRSGRSYLAYSVSYVVLQSDLLLVGGVLGPAAAGVYGVVYKLVDYAVQLIWRVPDSLIPIIAELHAADDRARLRTAHRSALGTSLGLALVVALVFWEYGGAAVMLWLGRSYVPTNSVFAAFAVLVITQVAVHSSIVVPYGSAQMRGVAGVSIVEATLKVVLAVVMLPRIGLAGVVVATIAAQSLGTLWFATRAACRITGDRWRPMLVAVLRPLVLPSTAAVIVAIVFGPSVTWPGIAGGTAAISVAFVSIYLTLSIGPDERRMIRQMIRWSS